MINCGTWKGNFPKCSYDQHVWNFGPYLGAFAKPTRASARTVGRKKICIREREPLPHGQAVPPPQLLSCVSVCTYIYSRLLRRLIHDWIQCVRSKDAWLCGRCIDQSIFFSVFGFIDYCWDQYAIATRMSRACGSITLRVWILCYPSAVIFLVHLFYKHHISSEKGLPCHFFRFVVTYRFARIL